MTRYFNNYKVEILDIPYDQSEGIVYPKTAVITFASETEIEHPQVKYGFITNEEIYKLIDSKSNLRLDKCYIKSFSLAKYRKSRGLETNTYITLNNFNAENAFFDAENPEKDLIDFSYADFQSTELAFDNSIFIFPVKFANAKFNARSVGFEYALFDDGNVNFSKCKFGNCDVSFKNAIFKTGNKKFEDIQFGTGSKSFLNTEFLEGDISFENTNFGNGRITFKVTRFGDGKVDFTHANFGDGEKTFERADFGIGAVSFRSATFGGGKLDFNRAKFGEGEVSFINTIFGNSTVSFVDADFGDGEANFKLAEFGSGKVDFHYAKFGKGDKIFDRTIFGNGFIDFRAVDFHEGKVNFKRSEFGSGDIIFEAIKLQKGKVTFKHTLFDKGTLNFNVVEFATAELVFEDVNFGDKEVSFTKSEFQNLTLKACHINNYFDLRVLHCETLDLSDSIIRDIVDIRPYDFAVEIKNLRLSGIRLLGRIYIDWRANEVKKLIYQQDSSYRSKSEQFRVLKENYRNIGQYNDEDEAYIEFKRTEAKADLKDGIAKGGKTKYYAKIFYGGQWLIFDKMGLYATAPLRVLVSVVIVYTFYSFLYILGFYLKLGYIHTTAGPEAEKFGVIGRSFYMSVVVFFTIGFGDYFPLGYLRALAGLEGFSGVFLMSYFVVAFVRKMLR